jgi:hypothetical protein
MMKRFCAAAIIFAAVTLFIQAEEVTLLDFSKLAGDTLPEGDNPVNTIALKNWDIINSRLNNNKPDTLIVEAPSKQYGFVLGARLRLSMAGHQVNIRPIISITNDPVFENGYGLVRGNRRITTISARVFGLNYPLIYIRLNLIDSDEKIIPVELGELNYEGWKDLTVDETITDYYGSLRFHSFDVFTKFEPSLALMEQRIIICFKDVKITFDDTNIE